MPRTASRSASVLLVLVGLVAAAALVLLPSAPADAATSGRVRGYVVTQNGETPPLKVAWFTTDWKWLGSRSVGRSGSYGLSLAPGTYRLQFSDQRPSYDVTKFGVTDATVTVRAGHTVVKNVRMHRGAAITGTVKTGGKAGKHATVTAANTAQQSFSTIANEKGQFAIGGLPAGSYSVFTYDRKKTYVAKSTYVKGLKAGKPQNIAIKLNKRGGSLLIDLYAGSEPINKSVVVTAVSKKTGQFWTTKAHNGAAIFKGLYPGRYKLVAPGYGTYLARSGDVSSGVVRPGRPAFGSFRLTERGGVFTGRLLASDDGKPVAKATVRLYDKAGSIIAAATTASDGTFRVGGQLGNTTGMTLVAFDSAQMAFLDTLKVGGLSIKVNQTKELEDLELPAKPSATVTGTVVDAYNRTIALGGATVQLVDAKKVVLGATVSAEDGTFTFDKRLLSQSGVSVVVAPTGTSSTMGVAPNQCQYTSSSHGGITLEAGELKDLSLVGIMRKTGGVCSAPLGDPVKN